MIKINITLDDADREYGLAQALIADNAARASMKPPQPARTVDELAAEVALAAFDAFTGSSKRALAAKIAELPVEALAEVAALVETKIPAKP